MCGAGERGEDLGYFNAAGLFKFARSYLAPMEVHHWKVDLPVEPPTISHTLNLWHESFCHIAWPVHDGRRD